MKGFFKEYQVKQFSRNERLQWVFEQLLLAVLNPVVTEEFTESYPQYLHGPNCKPKMIREKIQLADISPNNIQVAQTIESPFEDVKFSVDEKDVSVFGDDFCYKFPLKYILIVWNRNKKILK